jgi:hypothetical protein
MCRSPSHVIGQVSEMAATLVLRTGKYDVKNNRRTPQVCALDIYQHVQYLSGEY